jgi:hypothetical protein
VQAETKSGTESKEPAFSQLIFPPVKPLLFAREKK